MEQLIDMLALLKEVSSISVMANFSRKLEGNNGRNFARKFAANYRMKIHGKVPRAANFRSKIRGVETIGVAKMWRNIAEISFQANFRQKALKSQEIHLHYFCTILYIVHVHAFLQHLSILEFVLHTTIFMG